MGRAGSTCGAGGAVRGTRSDGYLGVGARIILKLIIKKQGGRTWTG
jgi:hypothetical protein